MSCIPFLTIGRDTTMQPAGEIAEEIYLPGSMLHTNFKISSSGETIMLTDSDGILIDSLYTQSLQARRIYRQNK